MKRSAKDNLEYWDWDKGQEKGGNFRYCDLTKATALQFPMQGLKYLHSYIHTAH